MALLLRLRDAPPNLEETHNHVILRDVPDRFLHCRHRARGRRVPALRAPDVDCCGSDRADRNRHSHRDEPHETTRSSFDAAVRQRSPRVLAGTSETERLQFDKPKSLLHKEMPAAVTAGITFLAGCSIECWC